MKFSISSENFGFPMPKDQRKYVALHYEEDDLFTGNRIQKSWERSSDPSVVQHIPLSHIPEVFYQSGVLPIGLLYAKEVIDGEPIVQYLRENEQNISTMNLPALYLATMQLVDEHLANPTPKKLAYVLFSCKTLDQFATQQFTNLRACYEHNEQDFYASILHGNVEDWLPMANQWRDKARTLQDTYLVQTPNKTWKDQMEKDFHRMIMTYFLNKITH